MKKLFAEGLGTFILVFAGTAAIVVNQASGGSVSLVGIALTFGLTVLAMIYSVGDISGAHLNPCVTLGFWIARRFPSNQVLPYWITQITGASMNPAHSLGPALVTGQLQSLWIYLTAPFLGAALAVIACRCTREEHCCSAIQPK